MQCTLSVTLGYFLNHRETGKPAAPCRTLAGQSRQSGSGSKHVIRISSRGNRGWNTLLNWPGFSKDIRAMKNQENKEGEPSRLETGKVWGQPARPPGSEAERPDSDEARRRAHTCGCSIGQTRCTTETSQKGDEGLYIPFSLWLLNLPVM